MNEKLKLIHTIYAILFAGFGQLAATIWAAFYPNAGTALGFLMFIVFFFTFLGVIRQVNDL